MATQFDKFVDRDNFKSGLTDGARLTGMLDLPILRKTKSIPHDLIPFNRAKSEKSPGSKWVHFFIDDYQFERLWNFPKRYINMLSRFEGVIAPDFSMRDTMSKAQRIWNCYRNRALAYYWQKQGINVVPSVGWAEYSELEWCLDGLPIGSVLAMETYGSGKSLMSRYGLIKGIERINRVLEPSTLVIYGKEIKSVNSICKNVIWLNNYCQEMKSRL